MKTEQAKSTSRKTTRENQREDTNEHFRSSSIPSSIEQGSYDSATTFGCTELSNYDYLLRSRPYRRSAESLSSIEFAAGETGNVPLLSRPRQSLLSCAEFVGLVNAMDEGPPCCEFKPRFLRSFDGAPARS